jgi:hypothetical protein
LELDDAKIRLWDRISKKTEPFELNNEIIWGIKPYQVGHGDPKQTREDVQNRIFHSHISIDDTWKPLIVGADVQRYHLSFGQNTYIKYGKWLMYQSSQEKFESEKLVMRQTSSDLKVAFDSDRYYPQNSIFIITSKAYNLKYLLCLLNSKLFNFFYTSKNPQNQKVYAEVKPSVIKELPIKAISHPEQMQFVVKADEMLMNQKRFSETKDRFTQLIQSQWPSLKLTGKLTQWHEFSFEDFRNELEKQKIKLTLQKQTEWLQFFNEQKQQAVALQNKIKQTDREIDEMVYQLYELTKEEVTLVEKN